ncbi:AAA family ATPase [Ruegeria sp. HKCCE4148]|uniref:AAA family ATPase n=1 Tax=Ruegeria sp. HKCCE4148 TaxID=2794829 RepID=UPI001AEB9892|nr:AAA family ATPase [Ruegeria sp. HKCCE4148]
MTDWKEQARAAGVPVFPISIFWDDEAGKYQKKPLTQHGHKDASTDVDQFDWTEANGFGMPMGNGRYAIDADTYKEGHEVWDWFDEHGVTEETLVIKTVSGGEQFLFDLPEGYEDLRTRNNVVRGLDTRGAGGWIAFGEGYEVVNDVPRAMLPRAVCATLDKRVEATEFKTQMYDFGWNEPDDALKKRVGRLRMGNQKFDKAMGHGVNDRSAALSSIAYHLKRAGFKPHEYAAVVMCMSGNARAHVEEQPNEPERALQRAWENNSATTPPDPERMANFAKNVAEARGEKPEEIEITDFSIDALVNSDVRAAEPLIENLVSAHLTYLVGDPKAGKSFVAMQMAEAVSLGKALWGNHATKATRVLYFAPENGLQVTVERLRQMNLSGDVQFRFKDVNMGPLPETIEDLIELLSEECSKDPTIGCIVLDTLRWMSGPPVAMEGNAQDKDFAKLEPLQSWCVQTGIAVIAVAHTNKDPNGREGVRSQLSSVAGSNLIAGTVEGLVTVSRILDPETKAPTPYGMIQRMGRGFKDDDAIRVHFDKDEARFQQMTPAQVRMAEIVKNTRKNGSSRSDIVQILDEFPDGRRRSEVRVEVMRKRDVSAQAVNKAIGDLLMSGRVKLTTDADDVAWLTLTT